MTEAEKDALRYRLASEFSAQVDYVRGSTALISALPVIYGIITFAFGDAIWASNPIYRTALEVPGAPQSWGVAFFTLGVSTIVLAARNRHMGVAVSTIITALVLASFMFSFGLESLRASSLYGIPPMVVYAIFSLAFMNRSRFAFKLWQFQTGWDYWWRRPGHPMQIRREKIRFALRPPWRRDR